MTLSKKITEERKKKGWSQEDLADKLGISRQAVSKWESSSSVPDLQKVVLMADLFEVSTDYLLKDNEYTDEKLEQKEEELYRLTLEEANSFLEMKQNASLWIANATSICILSPVLLILLSSLTQSPNRKISDGVAAGLGCTVLFSMVAVAVFIFITKGLKMNEFNHLTELSFKAESEVVALAKEKLDKYEDKYLRYTAIGVVICIISIIPIIIAGAFDASDSILCVAFLLALISIGVNIIIRVGIIKGSYDTLLQQGEFSVTEKHARKKLSAFSSIYWCLATAIYLAWSFWTARWNFTWLVWPVAGVLYASLAGIARIVMKVDET